MRYVIRSLGGAVLFCSTLAILGIVWYLDARLLNYGFDAGLALVKAVSSALDQSGKVESVLRALNAEKMLLFGGVSFLLRALGWLMKSAWE